MRNFIFFALVILVSSCAATRYESNIVGRCNAKIVYDTDTDKHLVEKLFPTN